MAFVIFLVFQIGHEIVKAECTSDTLTSVAGYVTSSDYFSSPLQAGDECSFHIRPTSSSKVKAILLVFDSLFIPTAELFVYQGDSVSSQNLLWSCLRCGELLPPPMKSQLGSAYVTFKSPVATSATMFRLRYVAFAAELSGQVAVDFLMGQAVLEAPRFENRLMRDLSFEWHIAPVTCGSFCDLTLVVEALSLDEGDTVRVYDGYSATTGRQLAVWEGGNIGSVTNKISPWLQASGDSILVLLETAGEHSTNSSLFEARVFSDAASCHEGIYCDCGESGPPKDIPLRQGPTMILSDGSDARSAMETDSCTWLIKPSILGYASGRLSWPSVGSAWAPRLTLAPDRVSVKRTGGLIRVYDGVDATAPLLWDCSGCQDVAPPPLEASSDALYLQYESDANSAYYTNPNNPGGALLEWTGWRAAYWTAGFETARGIGSSSLTLLAGSAPSIRAPYVDSNLTYAPDLDYKWIIIPPATTGGTIRLAFNRLELRNCVDRLEVYVGRLDDDSNGSPPALFASYQGCSFEQTPAEWIVASISIGLSLRLITTSSLSSHEALSKGVVDFGYYSDAAKYRCGHVREPGVLRAPSFLFSDGSRPTDEMGKSLDCTWQIVPLSWDNFTAPVVEHVSLVFARLDVRGGSLEVRDGFAQSDPLLWTCQSCQNIPPIITSSGSALFVRLQTGSGRSLGSGFEARYYAVYEGGRGIGDSWTPLYAAAAPSVQAPAAGRNTLSPRLDMYFAIDVGGADPVTLAFSALDLRDPHDEVSAADCTTANVTVYDGSAALDSALLGVFCGSEMPLRWLLSSGPTMTLRLRIGDSGAVGNFDVSYFSERAQRGCGGSYVPDSDWPMSSRIYGGTTTILRAPSFLFSDGSDAADSMRTDELCEWIIAPRTPAVTTTIGQIILRFPRLNLGLRGKINVSDAHTGRLLWRCERSCTVAPPSLALRCQNNAHGQCAMRIVYDSRDAGGASLGGGFLGHYFTTTQIPRLSHSESHSLLLMTHLERLSSLPNQPVASWAFTLSERTTMSSWQLRFDETVANLLPLGRKANGSILVRDTQAYSEPVAVFDGNDATRLQTLVAGFPRHCGMLRVPHGEDASSVTLYGLTVDAGTQVEVSRLAIDVSQLHFRTTKATGQQAFLYNGSSSSRAPLSATNQSYDSIQVAPAAGCAWALSGDAFEAAEAKLEFLDDLVLPQTVSLKVYAGSSVNGELLYMCAGCRSNIIAVGDCCKARGETISSTCGKLFLRLSQNDTVEDDTRFEESPFNSTKLHVGLRSGAAVSRTASELCWDDPRYVPPSESSSESRPLTLIIIILAIASVLVLVGLIGLSIYMRGIEKKRRDEASRNPFHVAKLGAGRNYAIKENGTGPSLIAPSIAHPRHYGRLVHSTLKTLMLHRGTCSICYSEDSKVFSLKPCRHEVCQTCLGMYAQAALGDISMFPLRCPMHHTGCKAIISDAHARLVLSKRDYHKFLHFSDRSALGDGMHCIKCGCFVNLPADSAQPSVQCPYCAYRWCVRCKCAWHPNVRCNERADIELEEWRAHQGAQRCPGCYKIIEKDDPETCNHMVHKSTDPLPCNRDRTDFCYCCGVEVTPDYPHYEVDSPGTVHFPSGVFQDCRAVQLGYATMLQKRRHVQHLNSRRRTAAHRNDLEVEVIGDDAFNNFLQISSHGRRPHPGQHERGSEAVGLSATERRRRRREQRESDARARRIRALSVETDPNVLGVAAEHVDHDISPAAYNSGISSLTQSDAA